MEHRNMPPTIQQLTSWPNNFRRLSFHPSFAAGHCLDFLKQATTSSSSDVLKSDLTPQSRPTNHVSNEGQHNKREHVMFMLPAMTSQNYPANRSAPNFQHKSINGLCQHKKGKEL